MTRLVAPRGVVVASVLLALASCAPVAAYERGKLAHPTMKPEFGSSEAREHVLAVQEGATGGQVGASSGCGCN